MIRIPAETELEEKKMPADGYVCRIVKATSGVNRYGDECLLLYLDVAEGDFANYFGRIYERRLDQGENKYPCVLNAKIGKYLSKRFCRLIAAIEASNDGYVYTGKAGDAWDEGELENLLVGVVFQEKEFINARGARRVILVPYEVKSVDDIRRGAFSIPTRLYE